jgi:hypothetical protein
MMRSDAADDTSATRRDHLVETIVGLVLIVLSALEIWFIVRTVQANMGRS